MPPKKNKQKMSLGDFLGDEKFGSWADEMENIPTAPAARAPDDAPSDRFGRGGSGFGADREFSGRGDRGPSGPPREDLPLPTAPPYTVFVGNLAFDLVEDDLAAFFAPESLKSVKVIRDREEKPKGFGYVEFDTLDGLKNGLAKSGTQLNSRTVRVSVAEPPKERERGSGFTTFGDDASTWRREGPPPGADSRGSHGPRSRFDDRPPREPQGESIADTAIDWRANRPARPTPPPAEDTGAPSRRSGPGFRDAPPRTEMTWERKGTLADAAAASERPGTFRRGSGFSTPREGDGAPSAAETEEVWSRGGARAPAVPVGEEPPKRGVFGGRGGDGPQAGAGGPPDAGDWRSQMKSPAVRQGSLDKSPTSSQPQTPQTNRKRLDLLPRSTAGSNVPSPLSSPRMHAASGSKSNPFGAARPIDVSGKEREIAEKLEKERESRQKEKPLFGSRPTPSGPGATSTSTPGSTSPGADDKETKEKEKERNKFDARAAQVRAQTSFAAAAAKRKEDEEKEKKKDGVDEVGDKLAEVTV